MIKKYPIFCKLKPVCWGKKEFHYNALKLVLNLRIDVSVFNVVCSLL